MKKGGMMTNAVTDLAQPLTPIGILALIYLAEKGNGHSRKVLAQEIASRLRQGLDLPSALREFMACDYERQARGEPQPKWKRLRKDRLERKKIYIQVRTLLMADKDMFNWEAYGTVAAERCSEDDDAEYARVRKAYLQEQDALKKQYR